MRRLYSKRQFSLIALTIALTLIGVSTVAAAPPTLDGCQIFPTNNIFNTPIDGLPVHPLSATYIANTGGTNETLFPDFGSGVWPPGSDGIIGIPFITVDDTQSDIPIVFTAYGNESDPGPYPIPLDAPNEGGPSSTGDRHVIAVDTDDCMLYELYSAYPSENDGVWYADSGATWDLTSNDMRPDGWTSSDAAGLPVMPLLIQYSEVLAGEINHALRATFSCTQRNVYVWPASHHAGSCGADYPPFGMRFRLRADFPVENFSPNIQVILRAFQVYGIINADNGSNWFLSGEPNENWDNQELRELLQVRAGDFEAVDQSALQIAANSYEAVAVPSRTDGLTTQGSLTQYPVTPTLQWNHTDQDFSWYNVVVWKDNTVYLNGWYEVGNGITCNATCTLDPAYTQPLLNGTYNWYVQPYHPVHGAAPFTLRSEFANFDVNIPAPEQPTNLNVIGDLTTPPLNPTFEWAIDDGTQWYNLVINRDNVEIYNTWFDASVICNVNCVVDPDVAFVNGNHSWTVQGYSTVLSQLGPISNPANFTINIPASLATNVVINGSLTTVPIAPQIVWDHDGVSEWYNVWVGGVNGTVNTIMTGWFPSDTFNCATTCTLDTPPDGVSYTNGTYQAWVQGYNSVTGVGEWAFSNEFIVNVDPSNPTNLTTVGSLTNQPVAPQLRWDYDDVSEWFQIYIASDDRTLVNDWYPASDFNCATTCTLTLPAGITLWDDDYSWSIRGWSIGGLSDWVNLDFTVDALDLQVVGALDSAPVQPDLIWDYDGVSEWFQIYVGGPNIVVNQWISAQDLNCNSICSLSTPLVDGNPYIAGDYQWWMQSWSTVNDSSGWVNQNFTVSLGDAVAPTNLNVIGDVTPDSFVIFEWDHNNNNARYDIQIFIFGDRVYDQSFFIR